jgi:hypothetical protein
VLQLSEDDRRWFVPKVTEEKWSEAKWEKFFHWLDNGGLSIIKWWLMDWAKKNGTFKTGQEAPFSATKRAMIEEGYPKANCWRGMF